MESAKLTTTTNKNPVNFYIILILLPFILFLILEVLLRIIGFGEDYPVFVESEQFSTFYQPNPDVIHRYFPNPELAPNISPDTEFFRKTKSPNSFRIVVQGGSTAAGFPYGRWGSIKGMLSQRFKRLYPDKDIEIINTAMSAVNSYTLLDFSDEIIDIEPDLILIYAGHNEFLGIMGVGSSFASKGGSAATRLYLKLKSARIYQLIEKVVYAFNNTEASSEYSEGLTSKQSESKTLMAKIAKNKNIPLESEIYLAGVEQFSGNLSLLLEKYQQHQIPVLIATLVSNERDQVPFSTVSSVDWKAYKKEIFLANDQSQLNLLKQQFRQTQNAELAYKIALNLLNKNQSLRAREYFQKARDLDKLRFRAPTEFNQIIRQIASKYDATVVDVESYFVKNSQNHIPGSDLILEHLHPNTIGYFYLAEAFSDTIIKMDFLGKPQTNFSTVAAIDDILISKSDIAFASYKINRLTHDYPFTNNTQIPPLPNDLSIETVALKKRLKGLNWLTLQQQLLVDYQKLQDYKEAAKIAALLCDSLPQQHQTAYIAGQLYFKIKDLKMAQYYHQLAVSISPQNIQYLLALAQDQYTTKEYKLSLKTLKKVLDIDPRHKTALFFSQKINQQLKGHKL